MTTPSFPLTPAALDNTILAALAEDLGQAGDLTSSLTVAEDARAVAHIVARKHGVLSGVDIAARAFGLAGEGVAIEELVRDGESVDAGAKVLKVSGNARAILTGERTALNFLGHLSGIATETRKLVQAVAHTSARICCTRKTTPGLRALEKYAVRCGGGFNHRFGLGDGILIKDNHIVAADGVAAAVKNAKAQAGHMVKIEVEVDHIDQIEPALEAGADVVTAKRIERVDSWLNRLQSNAFNSLLGFLTGARFGDLNCSLRAFKRTVLEQLTIYGTLYRYLAVIAFRQGFRVEEVKVRHIAERGTRGVFGPMTYARRILDVLGVVFLTRFTHKPLRFFGALGGSCMGAGGLIATWVGVASWLDPNRALFGSAAFLLGVLLFVLGVQIIGFGLVGEIVIFTQARNIREYRIEGVWGE